jgi:hypothetical protein
MNSLDERGIARERMQRSGPIGPEQLGSILWLPIQVRDVELGQRLLEVAPDPLDGVECWAIGRQAH